MDVSVIFLLVVSLVGVSYVIMPFPGHTYLLINTEVFHVYLNKFEIAVTHLFLTYFVTINLKRLG